MRPALAGSVFTGEKPDPTHKKHPMNQMRLIDASVREAMEQINEFQPADATLEDSEDCIVTGVGGVLDSLGVVSFVLALEEALRSRVGSEITLFDEHLIADPTGPFETVSSLKRHIMTVVMDSPST